MRKLWGYAAERAPSTHPVAGSPAPDALSALGNFDGISYAKGASVIRQLIAHIGDDAFVAGVTEHLRSHEYRQRRARRVPRRDGARRPAARSTAWSAAWLRHGRGRPARRSSDGVLTRTPPDRHPADRPHTLDVAAFAGGREVGRVRGHRPRVSAPRCPGSRTSPTGRSSCPTPATSPGRRCRSTPRTLDALAGRARRRAGRRRRGPCSGSPCSGPSTAPRSTPASRSTSSARPGRARRPSATLSRVALVDDAARSCRSSSRRPSRSTPSRGSPRRPTSCSSGPRAVDGPAGDGLGRARRAGVGADRERHVNGCGAGRPATASRTSSPATTTSGGGCCGGWPRSASWATTRSRRPRPPTARSPGSLAALGVRAVRPTAEAKEWAWATLRDDDELSNYAALSVAGGFWVAPDPELVRPYVEQVGDLLVHMSARMSDDALSRVVDGDAPHPPRRAGDGGCLRRDARARRPHAGGAPGARRRRPRAARGARRAVKRFG